MNSKEAVVYIVEDDASFRKSVERLIRTVGYKVETFGSANEFLTNADIRYPGWMIIRRPLHARSNLTNSYLLDFKRKTPR
jgi:FixJ family two-component response regulator